MFGVEEELAIVSEPVPGIEKVGRAGVVRVV